MLPIHPPPNMSLIKMTEAANPSHPYFPQDAIIPDYEPNTSSLEVVIRSFVGLVLAFVAAGLYLGKRANPRLGMDELGAMAWFLLCKSRHVLHRESPACIRRLLTVSGCLPPGFFLHAFFEGYFVLYHASLAGSQSLFAQLWKEYALSDSRYMTSDPFMLCIETLTVVREIALFLGLQADSPF